MELINRKINNQIYRGYFLSMSKMKNLEKNYLNMVGKMDIQ